jgi:hypothetical protein
MTERLALMTHFADVSDPRPEIDHPFRFESHRVWSDAVTLNQREQPEA